MKKKVTPSNTSDHLNNYSEISEERWYQAQEWELAFWDNQNIKPAWWKRTLRPFLVLMGLRPSSKKTELDDRNYWWKEKFNNYEALPNEIDNACELGCGPYTNMRLIIKDRHIKHIHCSDPLARNYINYDNAWLAKAHRSGLVSVDFHPAEKCPYKTDYFNLTVMINVLDHVKNPIQCLNEAVRITAPGGYIIIGQDLTGDGDMKPSNPGHPFYFSHERLETILDLDCDRIFHNIVPREEVSDPEMHCGALLYIGVKKTIK